MQASAFPPSYSASSPAPYYSSVPLEGEERIEYIPRGASSTTVSENITKACSFLTVIFKDQDATEDFPTYGRGSTIHGEIGLKSNAGVLSVSVKLKGHLHLSISDSGSMSITVVSESIELWTQDPARCNPCPSVLPFAITFPQNFTHGERSRPIPPSFHEAFYQQPVVSAQCSYFLKVTVHYGGTKMAFWKPSRSYSLQLNYRPRTRPQRPISHLGRFMSTMKQVPEDWLQIDSIMRVRESASTNIKPISCQFFVPSVGAFGLGDTIPFHIQLSSNLASLRFLLPEEVAKAKQPVCVQAFIARQMMVEANTRKCWRTKILGKAAVRAVPPPLLETTCLEDGEEVCVDWEGEVRCEETVRYGGFNVGTVMVKDFLVFAVTPPNPRGCPLLTHQYSQPIKLVTDAWTDDTVHPSDI